MLRPVETITSVAIIGNGLMGQGIAQVFARAGKSVTLIGRNACEPREGDGSDPPQHRCLCRAWPFVQG